MSKTIECTNQQELNSAVELQLKDKQIEIELRGAGYFDVCDSSQVRAYGSSQVTACDSSQVRAYGSSQVTASKQVAVTVHDKHVKATGGVQINYKKPSSTEEWMENYDLHPDANGVVILFKAVTDEYKSGYGMCYAPGTTPSAPDWDGLDRECGGGLHFCPLPVMALGFHPEATKFVGCPVLVSEIVVHPDAQYPNKIKAPRVFGPCFEVDINGKPLTANLPAKSEVPA